MEPLVLDAAPKTPIINLNASNGVLLFEGRSTPEDSIGFYEPILNWLDAYSANPQPLTEVNLKFEYFNTSSSKCILDVLKKIVNLHKKGNAVKVKWFSDEEDEDMQEAGEDYSDILELPFEIIKVKM